MDKRTSKPPRGTLITHANDAEIIIERREEVGRIHRDDSGSLTMMESAFMFASHVLGETLSDADPFMRLEFRYGSHTFSITAEPVM